MPEHKKCLAGSAATAGNSRAGQEQDSSDLEYSSCIGLLGGGPTCISEALQPVCTLLEEFADKYAWNVGEACSTIVSAGSAAGGKFGLQAHINKGPYLAGSLHMSRGTGWGCRFSGLFLLSPRSCYAVMFQYERGQIMLMTFLCKSMWIRQMPSKIHPTSRGTGRTASA